MAAQLPAAAYLTALATLPWASHRALSAALAGGDACQAWADALAGRGPGTLGPSWQAQARSMDVAARWQATLAAGVRVLTPADRDFPTSFAEDPEPPAVLFARGDLRALDGPRVAIVGTRRCSQYGRDVARELGHDLAAAGVRVVSGLALGIDGAAHAGALLAAAAPPVGVVGSGLDVVYPRRHTELWQRVAGAGVVLSEVPLGGRPEPWRFPARNRLIAALVEVVVVVESHAAGGSMHTVDAAVDRDRTVMAVPGPVRSAASLGTNRLLAEGLPPARDAGDVLVALGMGGGARRPAAAELRAPPDAHGRAVLDALGWTPATLDQVAARVGCPIDAACVGLGRLEAAGWVVNRGGWWEQVAVPP